VSERELCEINELKCFFSLLFVVFFFFSSGCVVFLCVRESTLER